MPVFEGKEITNPSKTGSLTFFKADKDSKAHQLLSFRGNAGNWRILCASLDYPFELAVIVSSPCA